MKRSSNKTSFEFEANKYPLDSGLKLIEASAGTGKTFALAHLVLRLLTEKEIPIEKILVVTFTEAAATELKSRISQRIENALTGLEATKNNSDFEDYDAVLTEWLKGNIQSKETAYKWTGLLLESQNRLDSADITTIHGFCKRTLNREAIDSFSSMSPKLEKNNIDLISEVIHDYWQKQILTLPKKHLRGLKDAGITIGNLTDTTMRLDNDPSIILNNSLPTFSKNLDVYLNHIIAEYWSDFVSYWEEYGKDLEDHLRNQAKEWRTMGIKDTKPFSPKPTKNRYEIINDWLKVVKSTNHIKNTGEHLAYEDIRKQKHLGNYFHPAVYCEVSKRCGKENAAPLIPKLQEAIAKLWDGPAEQTWYHALIWAKKELNNRRQKKGTISFGGLLKTLDPLISADDTNKNQQIKSARLIEKLRIRYQVALIDEFQDTDPLQWRLIREIFYKVPQHLLIMVGDPKQSIYRFRGGDLSTYLQAREEVDRIDELRNNYRTSPSLMFCLNTFMSPGLKRTGLQVPTLIPCKNARNNKSAEAQFPLKLLTVSSTSSENKFDIAVSKGELEKIVPIAVTNEVIRLLKDHTRRIKPSDICVIVSRHEQAASIRDVLATRQIPSCLVSQGDVLKSDSARILQRFLDCLANPSDSKMLRLLACSALLQWDIEKVKLAEQSGELTQLALRFNNWSRRLAKLGLMGCLSELLEGHKVADLAKRGRILNDLQQCTQLVQETIHQNSFDARSAARWLRQERMKPIGDVKDERMPHNENAESAINIITVHRSKGLEYRIVICPYLWQAPTKVTSPIWRSGGQEWVVSINDKWGSGKMFAEEAKKASYEEAERLAYVAMTRAKDQLIILWAKGLKQEGNPLSYFLFGELTSNLSSLDSNKEAMIKWFNTNQVKIKIDDAVTNQLLSFDSPKRDLKGLKLGPVPNRDLDITWGRSSYSSLISKNLSRRNQLTDLIGIEEEKESDEQELESFMTTITTKLSKRPNNQWSIQGPLGDFPRGAVAGDCLHKILEKIDFQNPLSTPLSKLVIQKELTKAAIGLEFCESVEEGLDNLLNISLGGPLGKLKLRELNQKRRIHELSFDMPLAHTGKAIKPRDLAAVFRKEPTELFGSEYPESLLDLDIYTKGFLTGSIDLVFTDHEDINNAKWWVVDWKSNWLGSYVDGKNKQTICGPIHYDNRAMKKQMILHHYPLQAHLYLVALNRFLKWRLPNYKPIDHLGGYIYIFLRGIPNDKDLSPRDQNQTTPGLFIQSAPIKRLEALSNLLEEGGA